MTIETLSLNMTVKKPNLAGVETDLDALPDGCLANVLSLTSPRVACRLSLVSSTFRSVAQSDAVWENFLPSDYLDIIGRSAINRDLIPSFKSKKELYLYLSDNHFLINDGTKSFLLDKQSGKKSYMLAAKELNIAWSETPECWGWFPLLGSRFTEVAQLFDVWWLVICGKIKTEMLSPKTTYAAYLVFSTLSGLIGFDNQPLVASFGINGLYSKTLSVCLEPITTRICDLHDGLHLEFCLGHKSPSFEQQHSSSSDNNAQCPEQRDDGWMEVEMGEFFVQGTENVELDMSLREVKSGNWKTGLIVEGIEIRPK